MFKPNIDGDSQAVQIMRDHAAQMYATLNERQRAALDAAIPVAKSLGCGITIDEYLPVFESDRDSDPNAVITRVTQHFRAVPDLDVPPEQINYVFHNREEPA